MTRKPVASFANSGSSKKSVVFAGGAAFLGSLALALVLFGLLIGNGILGGKLATPGEQVDFLAGFKPLMEAMNPVAWLSIAAFMVFPLAIAVLAANLASLRVRLALQSYHDGLTGLPNRVLFGDRLEQLLRRVERSNERAVIFLFDIDAFRSVNDQLGRQSADRLLVCIADRLQLALRKSDTVARLEGDQFAVLATLEQESALSAVHERIRACFAQPFELATRHLAITVSLGHAIFPDDGRTADMLLKTASARMARNQKSRA